MESCLITPDAKKTIILKNYDASAQDHTLEKKRQLGLNKVSLASSTDICSTATRSNSNLCYFAKFAAVTTIAACVVSSASAFTGSRNQMAATPMLSLLRAKQASIYYLPNEHVPLSVSSRTILFLSAKSESSPVSSKSDQQEWKAVFMALQLYKAAYGDLKVPLKFVVPSASPWPEQAWGMKLGQKVGSIRETGLYVHKSQQRRQQLEKLGFVWKQRAVADSSIPFDQIYDALATYRAEIKPSGPLTIPIEFTVPDAEPWPENTRGLPLGRSIKLLRSKAYLEKNAGAEEKLRQIGFETDKKLSANDKRFQAVYVALERYKETYGDLLIPQPFVVPSDSSEWPEESWGLRLGARVNAIRSQGTFIKNNSERQDMLDELGFVWTPPEKETKKRGRKTLGQIDEEEKRAMLEVAGNSAASQSKSTRSDGESISEEGEADSFLSFLNFDEEDQDDTKEESVAGQPTWGLEAGRDYDGFGNNNIGVATEQEIDDDYEAPRTLGDSLMAARRRALDAGVIEDTDSKRPTKRKREAEIPWFNDDFGGVFVFEDVVEALTIYKKGYGNFTNLTQGESDFVVPIKNDPMHSFDDDFDDTPMTEEEIEAEISRLERDMSSEEDFPGSTTASLNEIGWPEHLEGMQLGDIAKRIRDGSLEVKHLPERKSQLDGIEFDWGDEKHFLDVPFEKAMCAMYAFYMVRGDMFVPPDYVMPDEDPWPRALAGYELGKAVKRIRELQNFFEAFHAEKVSLLRMIDFVWFPTLALNIDPDEPEMSAEMLLLGALGHPDYHQLDEIPMGLPEKIMGDGPFHTSDDPRQWWREWHNWDYVAEIWHEMGTRDRAMALRKKGYPRMAAEHEEKYGPGVFKQINEYFENILAEISLEEVIGKENAKSFNDAVYQYQQLINKWDDQTESERLELPGFHLSNFTLYGRAGGLPAILKVYTETFEESERQRTDLPDQLIEIRDTLFGYLDELVGCTDMDDFELDIIWRFRIKLYLTLPLHDHFDISNKKAMDQQRRKANLKEMNIIKDELDSEIESFELNGDVDDELPEDDTEVVGNTEDDADTGWDSYEDEDGSEDENSEDEEIEEEVGI